MGMSRVSGLVLPSDSMASRLGSVFFCGSQNGWPTHDQGGLISNTRLVFGLTYDPNA